MFAQEKEITKLWIDKECIYQREGDEHLYPHDHEHGVQMMDVVYGDSTCDTVTPKFKSTNKLAGVHKVIARILSDPRWSRGWIFQEDHLASARMELLIPCSKHFERGSGYDFGSVAGELQVCVADFRKAVTLFHKAHPKGKRNRSIKELLSRAKQYNIYNKRVYKSCTAQRNRDLVGSGSRVLTHGTRSPKANTKRNHTYISLYPTMTKSVLDDIRSRSLEHDKDRVPILANALRFTERLDISDSSPLVRAESFGLSAILFALILMNGEILRTSEYEDLPSEQDIMNCTLPKYLERCEYLFNAPSLQHQQSFISKCRMISPKITRRGVETRGFLFKLLPCTNSDRRGSWRNTVRLNKFEIRELLREKKTWKKPQDHHLDLLAHNIIEALIEKLEDIWPGSALAEYLERKLKRDRDPRQPLTRSDTLALDMMSVVSRALLGGDELHLARLASSNDNAKPAAIFVKPEPNGWATDHARNKFTGSQTPTPTIFVSWNNPTSKFAQESWASLQIAAFDNKGQRTDRDISGGRGFLRSYGWVNGVCAFEGKHMKEYVFPVPGILEVNGGADRVARNRKRKRGADYDED
ncbi:hypothetical protein EK21DRAFT_59364 [Setomelanomma holmii]|uniref:Heterokaryon incompatibility domain-containing protein n=1 Tax=Setomelanomma holmii TaxID=210430 RepID=A0A9P4HGF7_9PLEO|nr:hypothetical protein EK21DRAFT_59364 [Setomelanomma holmii]